MKAPKIIILTISIFYFSYSQSIKPKFKISDVEEYFDIFIGSKKTYTKNQFETTSQFKQRKLSLDTIKNNEVVYFNINSYTDYNADTEILTLKGKARSNRFNSKNYSQNRFLVKYKYEHIDKYLAHNILGAKVYVTESKNYYYTLNLINEKEIPHNIFNKNFKYFTLKVKKSVEEYKSIVKKDIYNNHTLSLIIGVKPNSPQRSYIKKSESYRPTYDEPYDYEIQVYVIEAEFIGVWLYNNVTHTILTEYIIPNK